MISPEDLPERVCAICAVTDVPLVLHHVAGIANDPLLTVWLCVPHHQAVTAAQYRLGFPLQHDRACTRADVEAAQVSGASLVLADSTRAGCECMEPLAKDFEQLARAVPLLLAVVAGTREDECGWAPNPVGNDAAEARARRSGRARPATVTPGTREVPDDGPEALAMARDDLVGFADLQVGLFGPEDPWEQIRQNAAVIVTRWQEQDAGIRGECFVAMRALCERVVGLVSMLLHASTADDVAVTLLAGAPLIVESSKAVVAVLLALSQGSDEAFQEAAQYLIAIGAETVLAQ